MPNSIQWCFDMTPYMEVDSYYFVEVYIIKSIIYPRMPENWPWMLLPSAKNPYILEHYQKERTITSKILVMSNFNLLSIKVRAPYPHFPNSSTGLDQSQVNITYNTVGDNIYDNKWNHHRKSKHHIITVPYRNDSLYSFCPHHIVIRLATHIVMINISKVKYCKMPKLKTGWLS